MTEQGRAGEVLGGGFHLAPPLGQSESLFPHVHLERDLDPESDRRAKTGVVDPHQENPSGRTVEQRMVGHRLSEAFEQHHGGNDGAIGEMPPEERLVGLKRPHRHHQVVGELDDPLDEKKRWSMWKDLGDAWKGPSAFTHDCRETIPPSTLTICPVKEADSSLQKYRMTWATSEGRPRRPAGTAASSLSSGARCTISVSMSPGTTTLTVIPRVASSPASDSAAEFKAPLLAA